VGVVGEDNAANPGSKPLPSSQRPSREDKARRIDGDTPVGAKRATGWRVVCCASGRLGS